VILIQCGPKFSLAYPVHAFAQPDPQWPDHTFDDDTRT